MGLLNPQAAQLLSWVSMLLALGSYFLACRYPKGIWSFERPLYHILQILCAVFGIYVFTVTAIPAWVVFNSVWIVIGGQKLRELKRTHGTQEEAGSKVA